MNQPFAQHKSTRNIKRWLQMATVLLLVFATWSASGCTPEEEQPETQQEQKITIPVKQNGSTIEWVQNGVNVQVQICLDDVLRVRYLGDKEEDISTEVMANRKWEPLAMTIDVNQRPIILKTPKMTVEVDPELQTLRVKDPSNELVIEEHKIDLKKQEYAFKHTKDDRMYGIHGYDAWESISKGIMRSKGGVIKGGSQGYPGGPWIWSTNGWGLLVDTVAGRVSDDREKLNFTMGKGKNRFEYYVMVGNPYELFKGMAEASGKSPMFPKWSTGFMNTEWGLDEKELKSIVNTYRKKEIPIDAYILDFDWKAWGEDNYGEFRWNKQKFPSAESGKLRDDMNAQGIKMAGITKPRIHVKTEQGKYAEENGFWSKVSQPGPDYFSKLLVRDVDFQIPEVRKWFWEKSIPVFETGLVGWWNDEADDGTATQFIMMQKALYEGQRSISNLRVWSINRNFFVGAQKYGYGLWSGDINTSERSMMEQRAKMVAAINVGAMHWGMDTGGFQATPDPELYARWMQFSAFTPTFRVHGKLDEQRQPWVYGPVAEKAATAAIRWRYAHLPYIYSYERNLHENGVGLVRPLMFDYPNLDKVRESYNEWMFGDFFLVSPVVEGMLNTTKLYLPPGTWYDYFRGTEYQGDQKLDYSINKETWEDVPLFVKKGAIIPSQPVMNYVNEKPVTQITIDVFPDSNETKFMYYDDDGQSYDYEKGIYFKQYIRQKQDGNKAIITFDQVEGSFVPDAKSYLIKVHGTSKSDVKWSGDGIQSIKADKDQFGDYVQFEIPFGKQGNVEVQM